ncbi:MAG TPA: tRNA(Ile)(2)-agmatinylcytidine synthase [candidate division Zixibacteria bacterium]|nr:tRNA(Ile)(2)-agmatinylcytidine synthase [candidate division Zixibacteria bacterium]
MKKILHVGIDDTDSLKGSCTTHLATLILVEIFDRVDFLDFPNLIRLNPNIPYKTRGNGAVAIRIKGLQNDLDFCRELILKKVETFSRVEDENTNPGVAFVEGKIPKEIFIHSQRAMWDVISIEEAEQVNNLSNVDLYKYKNGRGIIGALGAIGNTLQNDFTYEHLSYRESAKFGTKRLINEESVIKADKATPLTFSNVDYEYSSIMITPRGADPVFAGIRGETVEQVRKAWSLIEPLEKITMQMVFRTNQHTNQHFVKKFKINQLKPHLSVIVDGAVSNKPKYIEGSHLIFSIYDNKGKIDCAAYEPTKRFRGQLSDLQIDDNVTVYGGVRPAGENHPQTINVERIKINSLVKIYSLENPFCDLCNIRLKSAGKDKGFKCPKCSKKYRNLQATKIENIRKLSLKEYLPPIVAHRHLTKPMEREGRNNIGQILNFTEVNAILKELVEFSIKNSLKNER